jgi:hypothetical protein
VTELEAIGLALLTLDFGEESAMNNAIPDTMGLSDEEIQVNKSVSNAEVFVAK